MIIATPLTGCGGRGGKIKKFLCDNLWDVEVKVRWQGNYECTPPPTLISLLPYPPPFSYSDSFKRTLGQKPSVRKATIRRRRTMLILIGSKAGISFRLHEDRETGQRLYQARNDFKAELSTMCSRTKINKTCSSARWNSRKYLLYTVCHRQMIWRSWNGLWSESSVKQDLISVIQVWKKKKRDPSCN